MLLLTGLRNFVDLLLHRVHLLNHLPLVQATFCYRLKLAHQFRPLSLNHGVLVLDQCQ